MSGEANDNEELIFTEDNPANIRKVIARYKNILIRGVKGVGKITHTVEALQNEANIYYVGNPVDFEGKRRPGSYEKYLNYILSLKKDLIEVKDMQVLLKSDQKLVVIIDEIYGRSKGELQQIAKLLDMENVQAIQIVGCLKNMGNLIDKIDVTLDLHREGALLVDKEVAKAICRIFPVKWQPA